MANRQTRVLEIYQNGTNLNFENSIYKKRVSQFIDNSLSYDIGKGDITTKRVINENILARAIIKSKQAGYICGLQEIVYYYNKANIKVDCKVSDGQKIQKDQSIVELFGRAQDLLTLERVGLNILRRLSGIATITGKFVETLQSFKTSIAATRKVVTSELMEKRAVFTVGGLTHRLGLDKFIMIKDCHLDILKKKGVPNPINFALSRSANQGVPVEIEVESLDQALRAAQAFYKISPKGKNIIMLDNMSPTEVSETLQKIQEKKLYEKIIFEASGGVNLDTAREYAQSGVDVISTSLLTEGANVLDLHQKILI